jgi:5'-nucleotidase
MVERNTGRPDYRESSNPSQTVILVDQDGVLADFDGEFLRRWQRMYPNLPYVQLEQRTGFFISDDYPTELIEQVQTIYNSPGFIVNLPPIPGGLEALRAMRREGYIIKICTAQIPGNRDCLTEKQDWIVDYLGKEWVKDLIIANDKTMIYGQILIDDKPEITGALTPSWEHVIFDAPYNKNVSGKRRLTSWDNWHGILVPSDDR